MINSPKPVLTLIRQDYLSTKLLEVPLSQRLEIELSVDFEGRVHGITYKFHKIPHKARLRQ
jgi:hypothetical protein